MSAIYKRELRSYFTGPLGYIFIAVFLAFGGLAFGFCTLMMGQDSEISLYFILLMFIMIIANALLTMKSFSEERKLRTEQLILTSPVSLWGMIMAKFLAAYTMFAGTFIFSCSYILILYRFGSPNPAKIFGYILAILFIGAVFISVGIFVSSLTESQFIAAIGTLGISLAMCLVGMLNSFIDSYVIRSILSWFSVLDRFNGFTYGFLDFDSILYYLSLTFIFLFLSARVFEKRRWA